MLAALLATPAPPAVATKPATAAPPGVQPRNIVLLIADGMGHNHVDAASLFEHGKAAYQSRAVNPLLPSGGPAPEPSQAYQHFPRRLAMETTYAYSQPYDSAFSWHAFDGVVNQTAIAPGKAGEEDPQPPAIAAEMLRNDQLDVVMGTGHPRFDRDGRRQRADFGNLGEDLWRDLTGPRRRGELASWTLVDRRRAFERLARGRRLPERVVGIARSSGTLQHDRSGDRTQPFGTPLVRNVPRLHEMATGALNVLDDTSGHGLFRMVEAATVDHAGELGRTIEEMVAFNDTVEAVVDWVEAESSWRETMVVVTADHETGYLLDRAPARPETGTDPAGELGWTPLTSEKGRLPEAGFYDPELYHTNQLVPLYAKGRGSARFERYADQRDLVRGPYLDNTGIANTVADLWGTPRR